MGVGFPGAGIMGGCELPKMGGTELRSSARILPTKPFLPGFAFLSFTA